MSFDDLREIDKEKQIATAIMDGLQKNGGRADKAALREYIIDNDEGIAEYSEVKKISKKTNSPWRPFDYKFNFALKNLLVAGFVSYSRGNPVVQLTEKGINVDMKTFEIDRDVYDVSISYWHNNEKQKKKDEVEAENTVENEYLNDFREKLLAAISKMSPKKFELFSRALLNKMGIEFTETGTQLSNDGGIDGYGYCRTDDFRTSRVVIQCKRWQGSVGSVEINGFLGAMNRFQADYGVFITNSRYTPAAREAARAGTPITLIDGDDLVRLVKKYELYVFPVQTYELDSFYDAE
ncbi:restriction endonuclease [Candidatus Saccharibacteria bacterium]|nr:restriction endonuclease [Candidatus Saccharibacteria bacterium]